MFENRTEAKFYILPQLQLSFVLVISILMGCRQKTGGISEELPTRGAVNEALSDSDRGRQSALFKVLVAFQEGVSEPEDLLFSAGNVEFLEGIPAFLDGKVRLVRWDFVGAPQDEELTVKLLFDGATSGPIEDPTATVQMRKYRVVDNGRGYAITRSH